MVEKSTNRIFKEQLDIDMNKHGLYKKNQYVLKLLDRSFYRCVYSRKHLYILGL